MVQLLPKLLLEQCPVWYFRSDFWALYLWEDILQNLLTKKQGEFLTENRAHKDCRNKRLLMLSPCHMPALFLLYIDAKISYCFVLFNTLLFSPMAWRCVSKIEYFMHVSKAFQDQEFKMKMWTETGKSTLGGNNSNVTDQLILTVTRVYTKTKFAMFVRFLL